MIEVMLDLALWAIAGAAFALALDILIRNAVHWLGPLLPSDLCGPDGWLVDTARRQGIFDRSARG